MQIAKCLWLIIIKFNSYNNQANHVIRKESLESGLHTRSWANKVRSDGHSVCSEASSRFGLGHRHRNPRTPRVHGYRRLLGPFKRILLLILVQVHSGRWGCGPCRISLEVKLCTRIFHVFTHLDHHIQYCKLLIVCNSILCLFH